MLLNEQIQRIKVIMRLNEGDDESKAAGAQIICKKTKRTLVGFRSKACEDGCKWNGFGGSIDIKHGESESVKEAVIRELKEEIGYHGEIELLHEYKNKKGANFTYHNFIGLVPEEFTPKLNKEHTEAKWVTYDELKKLKDKHFGLIEYMDVSEKNFLKYL